MKWLMRSKNLVIPFLFLLTLCTFSHAADLGIVTGSKTGTYYQFGLDIKEILNDSPINLQVHTSKGSLANMYAVLKEPKAQLAIVQSDVLKFLSSKEDSESRRMVKKTRMVYPLYNEEVHILARVDVSDFYDLEGRKVAVGGRGSGTFLTAKTLLNLAGIKIDAVYEGGKTALQMLKDGQIDAMFYVAGFPVSLFKDSVSLADDLKLLEITDKSITEFYVPSKIPASAYSWMKDDVNSVAVKAVIMTFDYKGDNCHNVYLVGKAIKDNLPKLKRNGHPKWNQVDLDYTLAGWKPYGCLKNGTSDGAADWLKNITEGI